MTKSLPVVPLLLSLIACAVPQRPGSPSAPAVGRAVLEAANQVRSCYRSPRVPTSGKRIATRLRVRYTPDGRLAGLPEIASQSGVTPDNQPYASKMAEAASLAVIRCSPVKLPPELHRGGWDDFYLTFSPKLLA